MASNLTPPWLYLLNALQKEWRTAELLKDRNPDPFLEQQLRDMGEWPPQPDRLSRRDVEAASAH